MSNTSRDFDDLVQGHRHCVRNIFANVMAAINQAQRSDGDPEIVLEVLSERVRSLAKTHNLINSECRDDVTLSAVVHQEIKRGDRAGKSVVRGPECVLTQRAAGSLGMAFHELGRNAATYGALSRINGRLAVDWTVDEDRSVYLDWIETGIRYDATSLTPGFGLMLVRSTVEKGLGGHFYLGTDGEGIRCTMTIPPEHIIEVLPHP